MCAQSAGAKVITVDQARAIAQQQFTSTTKFNAPNAKMTLSHAGMNLKGTADYYVFNCEGGNGFVVVAGDDISDPILAYSDRGSFDINNAPQPIKDMFECYQQTLDVMRHNPNLAIKTQSLRMNPDGVAPMFLNQWGEGPHWHQFSPYNYFYPSVNGEKCVAGCAPIAFAHIMKGLQYPTYGNGMNTFHYDLGGQTSTATANFNHTYKYSNMKNGYTGNETY